MNEPKPTLIPLCQNCGLSKLRCACLGRGSERTPQFQAFLDSLERPEVKRIPTPRQTLGSTWATRHFNPQ